MGPNGEWFVRYYYGNWSANNLSDSCRERLQKLDAEGASIHGVEFGEDHSCVIRYDDGK